MNSHEFMGIKLGESRDPIEPVMEEFRKKGLDPHPDTIGAFRSGRFSGTRYALDILSRDTFQTNNGSKKNLLYRDFLATVTTLIDQLEPSLRGTKVTTNLTEDAAELLPKVKDSRSLRLCFRAMRADFSTSDRGGTEELTQGTEFNRALGSYLADFTKAPSLTPPLVKSLEKQFPGISTREFYQLLYKSGPRTISNWLMYEVPVLLAFYTNKIGTNNNLTWFDEEVLNYDSSTLLIDDVAAEIELASGVSLNHEVLQRHRNALVCGLPVSFEEFKKYSLKPKA